MEAERQQAEVRLIAERKQRKLERRRSAETPLSSSLPDNNDTSNPNGLSAATLSPLPDSSPATPPPTQPFNSLSPSVRSSSDVTVSTSPDRQPTWTDADVTASIGQSDELNQRRPHSSQQQQQTESVSEIDEDGSSDYEERAAQLAHGPLMMRRASTRSMSLDESEMSQMRASRMGRLQSYGAESAAGETLPATAMSTAAATAAIGGEHRKLTDPLPSSQQSATPSSYPSIGQQREKQQQRVEEEERAKKSEEKAAAYMRAQKSRAYIKLFSLPESEELICDFSCAVQRAILLHGRMYVSTHFVCFFSSIFSHKTSIVLPMDDVLFVASAKVALVFDNSLKVQPHTHTHTHTHIHHTLHSARMAEGV